MIIKSYEFKKINPNNKIILLYGKNEGHKKEIINNISKDVNKFLSYEQDEIINNQSILFENIFSKSLFNDKKIIIIKRANDKFIKIVENINQEKIEDSIIFIIADNLEKKSKLRTKFEKDKNFVCVAFYPDNEQTLLKLAADFFRTKKIQISTSIINLIINKCKGDREVLFNELNKIELYSKSKKPITKEIIVKLINLIENHNISELVDCYLSKNDKKILSILNENNFNNEECVTIIRTFLIKTKKLLKLAIDYEKNNNIELTISSAKPPIFWKDKEITKQQIYMWSLKDLQKLINKINNVELHIKKNINLAVNIIMDFILDKKLEN